MIAILSTEDDLSTEQVMDWLYYKQADFIRINDNHLVDNYLSIKFEITNTQMKTILIDELNNKKVDIDEVNVVWFRKFGFYQESDFYKNLLEIEEANVKSQIMGEYNITLKFFTNFLNDKKWLSHPKNVYVNKVDVIIKAKECKLDIPETFIVSRKSELKRFVNNKKKYITKPIHYGTSFKKNGKIYSIYTALLNEKSLEGLPNMFFPSLIQEYIEKEFELRVFYFNKKCYSMAIFSQNDEQTKVDFRNYNDKNPNRTVPYNLSKSLTKKIENLMVMLGLNTGSLDIIKAKNGKFYFLEVNPVGQFGMVSKPCNYNLEEKIADYLIKNDYE